MLLSCIIPYYDEAENSPLFQAAEQALAPRDRQYELIFVDDGSRDETLQELGEALLPSPGPGAGGELSRNPPARRPLSCAGSTTAPGTTWP